MSTAIGEKRLSTKPAERDVRQPARQSKAHPDCRSTTIKSRVTKISLALSSGRDNHPPAATAEMAILIVAVFPSRLSRYRVCQRMHEGHSDLARFAENGSPLGPEIPTISLERLQNFGPFRPDDDQLNTAVSRAEIVVKTEAGDQKHAHCCDFGDVLRCGRLWIGCPTRTAGANGCCKGYHGSGFCQL